MGTLKLWHWWITDAHSGQRVMSPSAMTEADALRLDSTAQRVYGTLEVKCPVDLQRVGQAGGHRAAPQSQSAGD